MKKSLSLMIGLLCMLTLAQAQLSFKNVSSRLTNTNFNSGCPIAIADWNFDGKDDIIRLDQGHICYVELQITNGQFQSIFLGDFGGGSGWAWGMAVADLDHNGYLDVAAGSYGPAVKILMTNSNGTGATEVSIPSSNYFVQNMTFADFNNDGWIDLFVCDDNAESHVYINNQAGTLTESFTTINFDVTSTDDSGNYGSVWTDFDNDGDLDLYIAKCRQSVSNPADGRRINVMFVNDGNGNFTENAAAYNINIGWQTWTASFGDLDNDGDLDLMITNHDFKSQIFENNGNGVYTDITDSTGFSVSDFTPIQSTIEDFDNDGYADIFVTGSKHRMFRNNGNMTFTAVENIFDNNDIASFAIGDINHDGRIDIMASYTNLYTNPSTTDDALWMNSANNGNHFVTLEMIGTISNKGAIGGRALVYGAWGVQLREVRAGDSYGNTCTPMLHFGVGQNTTIDSIVVIFPSGSTQTLINPAVDQFIRIIENDCVSPFAGISYSNPAPYLCSGTVATITALAPPNSTYLWSDSLSTGPDLIISNGGEYNVIISEQGNNCTAISPTLIIEQDPDQTPVIEAGGETDFCNGSSVTLSGPAGMSSYTWSDGSTSQQISVTQSGIYSLTVLGYCNSFTSANTIPVTVRIAADPVSSNVSLPAPGTATLTATGSELSWYDSQSATVVLGNGPSFTTPFLNTTTSFWVENTERFNNGIFNTGQQFHSGMAYSGSNSTNAATLFDVQKACILQSVKVYTDLAGTRRIELRNDTGLVLQFVDVNLIPDTQVVTLNFNLSPGQNYQLATNGSINAAIPGWGNQGPRLRRSTTNVSYPYIINDALSITNSTFGPQYFYYFYDWQVEKPGFTCESNRIEVVVNVGTTGTEELSKGDIQLFPNPATDVVQVRMENASPALFRLFDAGGRLLESRLLNQMVNEISVSHLAPGLYMAELQREGETMHSRLVKQ
jgi:hypothetical protein